MKKGELVFAALLLSIGIVILGYSLKRGIENFKDKDRVVSVKGLVEKEVMANHVIMPLVYKEIGNDLPILYQNMERKNRAITDFLVDKGIDKNEISFSAPEIVDLKAERYGSPERIENRYNATSVITVSSDKVALVRELMISQSDLLKQGIALIGGDYRYKVEFQFTKLNEIKPQMIEEATRNARAAAEKFAADSDSKLGKIRTADQGTFTISDRDAYTPYIKNIRVVTRIDYYLK